jgi:hypothetical protein
VNIIKDRKGHADPEHADGAGGGGGRVLGRRSVLGGLAAVPVVYGIGAASPALAAASASAAGSAQAAASAGSVGAAYAAGTAGLARGVEQRYHAPLLTSGSRLVLPEGIKVTPVLDYYSHPRLVSAETVWPRMKAADGSTVDASIVPDAGAPTRVALLSGFRVGQGWYELVLANKGASRRVTWDAAAFPFLFIFGEFGAAGAAPYNRFYSLALQPFARSPYTPNGLAF